MVMRAMDRWIDGFDGDGQPDGSRGRVATVGWLVAAALVCRKLCSCDGGESLPDSMLSIGLRRETAEMAGIRESHALALHQ